MRYYRKTKKIPYFNLKSIWMLIAVEIDMLETLIKQSIFFWYIHKTLIKPHNTSSLNQRETLNANNHKDNYPLKKSTIFALTSSSELHKQIIAKYDIIYC